MSAVTPLPPSDQTVANLAETSESLLAKLEDAAVAAGGVNLDTAEFAAHMDSADELGAFRSRFAIPHAPKNEDAEAVYLCGNSLGLMPLATQDIVNEELEKWKAKGVEGHFEGERPWVSIDETVEDGLGRIVGALPMEVVAMNSLSTNLHLLFVPFYRPTADRYKIVIEGKAFPSDQYAVESQIRFHGLDPADALVEMKPRDGETTLRTEDVVSFLESDEGASVALVFLSGIQYYTGQYFDIKAITAAGKAAGAVVGWDLAHAVGNVELQLHEWGVDFAMWCHYKYLNSGPGAIGGAFVHERHANNEFPRFAGWWGHDRETRFQMGPDFVPLPGACGYQLSNPPVLQTVSVLASTNIFDEAEFPRMRAKALLLTRYFEHLLETMVPSGQVSVITPRDPQARGCQLSLVFANPVRAVHERITDLGVICDVREPDVMRIAPVPLYNTYTDVFRFVSLLRAALEDVASA